MSRVDRYRRSPGVVISWAGSQAYCVSWITGTRVPISPQALALLDGLSEWTSAEELRDRVSPGADAATALDTMQLLHALGLAEREDQPPPSPWREWSPEAAYFHFSTKNGSFPDDPTAPDRALVEKARHHPPPPPTKRVDGPRRRLADAALPADDLERALKARRTWRRFSDRLVPAGALGAVLSLTFGVQARGRVEGQGPIVLRTSPSGGSRHPIEAYVLAWNVDGLAPGAYHFDSDTRELVDLRRAVSARDIPDLLANQSYFAGAGAAVIMSAVFARTMWRYPHSRAYRAVLIDAGHLGQTFCLAATALGLAPFTTMAFSEARLEALLDLDGVSECPLYVAGVGMPDPLAADAPGRVG